MDCPFKKGDRIVNKGITVDLGGGCPLVTTNSGGQTASVIEITNKGFKYELDTPVTIHPLIGWYREGEVYPEGFGQWELITM